MSDQEKTVTISQKKYDELIRRDYLLACLERYGLNKISDFWVDAAIEKYREKYPEED